MPEVIKCTNCGAPLRLREEYIDQEVRCPSCQQAFIAGRPEAAVQSREDGPRHPLPLEEDRPPRDGDDDEDDRLARRRRAYRQARYDRTRLEPHRGGTILAMGIISLCLFCAPAIGIALGIAAAIMAHNDLAKMRDGHMDPSGESQTRTGQVCGVLGVIFTALALFFFIVIAILGHVK
jgi:DNA-directed RNA polymerase subunit RPC12/RpoP